MSEEKTEPELPEIGAKASYKTTEGELAFTHFVPKSTNEIKIYLTDPYEGDKECIWVCVTDEDYADYRSKVDDDRTRICILRNVSVLGPEWGACIPYRLNGEELPESCLEIILDHDDEQDPILNQHPTSK